VAPPRASMEKLSEALRAAEEAAGSVLERGLGRRLGDYNVILKVEEDGEVKKLTVDVEVFASRSVPRGVVDALVEEAVESARRAFEEVLRRSARR
jgi:hypothetical protein